MILTPSEYAEAFRLNKKKVSVKTIIRRIQHNTMPSGHKGRQLPGKKGCYVIEIKENI